MNKRGMLLVEETLKMIVAVIALSFLIYFLVSIYFARVQENELIQANADIDLIRQEIPGNENAEIVLNNPVGWKFFEFKGDMAKPNACANQDCFCICDEVLIEGFYFFEDNQFNECNTDGACLGMRNFIGAENIEIEQVTKILIEKQGGISLKKIE